MSFIITNNYLLRKTEAATLFSSFISERNHEKGGMVTISLCGVNSPILRRIDELI
ncbi:MAG: hypothetical protein GY821_00940 [Gammaproteobacteria bacterium]|nr:hypothetical protein [Gammaproteobacteria bacterium]